MIAFDRGRPIQDRYGNTVRVLGRVRAAGDITQVTSPYRAGPPLPNVTYSTCARHSVYVRRSRYPTSRVEALGLTDEAGRGRTRATRRADAHGVTDGLGRKTDYAHDTSGNVTSVTHLAGTPDAVTTSVTWEPAFNQIATVTDPLLSHTTALTYNRRDA